MEIEEYEDQENVVDATIIPLILNGELFKIYEVKDNNSISAQCTACIHDGKDVVIEGYLHVTSNYRRHYKVYTSPKNIFDNNFTCEANVEIFLFPLK